MKNEKILPFANETKKLKNDFKKVIDEMDDEEFIDFMFFIMNSGFDEDFDEDFDEEFDEDFGENFENPFSGEMVNFKCPDCKKLVLILLKLLMIFMKLQKKNHKLIVITVIVTVRLQFTTKLLTEKYFNINLQKCIF